MKDLAIACIQTVSGDIATPDYVDDVLRRADERIDLVVLPEICNVPYFPLEEGSRDADLPVLLDGPEVAAFGRVAKDRGVYMMPGLYITDGERRYNAAILLGPDGKIVKGRTDRGGTAMSFHKVHLCDVNLPTAIFCETAYFTPGDRYVVWDLPFGSVGALICYDRHFPEAWIALREMGAEIVCVCTTSPLSAASYFVPEIQGMSVTQSVYAAVANRVGKQVLRTSGREAEFLGSSVITGPVGEIVSVAPERQNVSLISAMIRAKPLENIRRSHQFHERRRPDTYVAARTREAAL